MEPSRSFTNFTQLRNALDNSVAQADAQKASGERPLAAEGQGGNAYHHQYLSNHMNRRSMRMDELVQVFYIYLLYNLVHKIRELATCASIFHSGPQNWGILVNMCFN